MILEKVEQMAPEQAKLVRDNIDTLLESGLLKTEGSEKASYELADDGWVNTLTVESNMNLMQQVTNTNIASPDNSPQKGFQIEPIKTI